MSRTTVTKNRCCICSQEIQGEMYVLEKVEVDAKFEAASLQSEWQFVFHPKCFCQAAKRNTLLTAIMMEHICLD